MEIASNTNIIKALTKVLKPIVLYLFPNVNKNKKAFDNIVMNIIANILGLGNAATPLGIQAMEELQRENFDKESLSDNMMMLIILQILKKLILSMLIVISVISCILTLITCIF